MRSKFFFEIAYNVFLLGFENYNLDEMKYKNFEEDPDHDTNEPFTSFTSTLKGF